MAAALLLAACGPSGAARTGAGPAAPLEPVLVPQVSGTAELLIAVSAVDEETAWIAGTGGTFVRTVDGGRTWRAARVPGADSLQFRDVHALDDSTAWLLAAGSGPLSRIYRTTDGGESWSLQFQNEEPEGFYDCLAFGDALNGLAYGDAVDGELRILRTEDGGETWLRVPPDGLPPALPGEGGFAASGTCLTRGPGGLAWIVTGAGTRPRVLRSTDRGRTWESGGLPLPAGDAAGAFSVTFRDALHGAAFGGDLTLPEGHTDNVALTSDGGRTWRAGGRPRLAGAVYGGAYVPAAPRPTLVIVGPGGADYSTDEGRTWTALDSLTYWGIGFASPTAGWIAGPEGRITRIEFRRPPGP